MCSFSIIIQCVEDYKRFFLLAGSFRTATVQRHSILQLPFRTSLLYNILLKVYLTGGGFDEEIHGGEQKIPGASGRNGHYSVILCDADDTC